MQVLFVVTVLIIILSICLILANYRGHKGEMPGAERITYKGLQIWFPKVDKLSNNQGDKGGAWGNYTGLTTDRPSKLFQLLASIIDFNVYNRILDVGCGIGEIGYEFFLALGHKVKYIGIDAQENLINIARANLPYKFLCADASQLTEKEFDVDVFMFCGISRESNVVERVLMSATQPEFIVLEGNRSSFPEVKKIDERVMQSGKYEKICDARLYCDSTTKWKEVYFMDRHVHIYRLCRGACRPLPLSEITPYPPDR